MRKEHNNRPGQTDYYRIAIGPNPEDSGFRDGSGNWVPECVEIKRPEEDAEVYKSYMVILKRGPKAKKEVISHYGDEFFAFDMITKKSFEEWMRSGDID